MLFSNKIKKTLAFILLIILFTVIICIMIVVFINSDYRNFSYTTIWTPLISILLGLTFIGVCLILIGGISLCRNSKILTAVLLVLVIFISISFLIILVFSLINSSSKALSLNFGCNTSNKDLKSFYNDFDLYLIEIDKTLCSNDCKCYDKISKNKIENHNVDVKYAVNYKQCSNNAKNNVNNIYDRYKEKVSLSNIQYYSQWYEILELNFNCVGFCTVEYNNNYYNFYLEDNEYFTKKQDNNYNKSMNKYLFTDINKGTPEFKGCLLKIQEWAPKKLLILGIVSIFAFIVSFIIIILLCCILFKKDDD